MTINSRNKIDANMNLSFLIGLVLIKIIKYKNKYVKHANAVTSSYD